MAHVNQILRNLTKLNDENIFELRERKYLKSRKDEEGANFIQLVSTHCFIPGYFSITCGAFTSS